MIVRQRLLTKLVSLWNEGQLVEKIDRLPIEFSPRNSQVRGRCCIHKERAVWKYKSLPLLGYDMTDEKDELMPLSDYAKILYAQARLIGGMSIDNPTEISSLICDIIS